MNPDNRYQDDRTPAQCRTGPIEDRPCPGSFCCLLYLLPIAATIFLALFSSGKPTMTPEEVKTQLDTASFGAPLLAIVKAFVPIIIALGVVIALCLILVVTTFIIPSIVTYIYIPVFLLLMLLAGACFIASFAGVALPFVKPEMQQNYAAKNDITTLIIGITFLLGFLAALLTICSKRSKFGNIVPVLKIAKTCFWSNSYIFIFSILFCLLSLLTISINYALLSISQTKKEPLIDARITAAIIILELLWTHGIMEAASDFFFESIAIHWYFKKRREENEEESCCDSLCLTIKLMFKHIGTIVFGHVLAYVPETLNTMLGRC